MNNKILNTLYILCLIVVIGIMSWRDMHPKVAASAETSLGLLCYYIGPDITPAMIPDDSRPITIGLGNFSYKPDGKAVWTSHGMAPTTFAQRQVTLQFHFDSLPQNPAETIKKINDILEDWLHKGDIINNLVLDYSPEKPDLKAYTALLKAAHDEFTAFRAAKTARYVIFAGVNIQWAEGPQKDELSGLRDYGPQFLIHLPQARISPETLSKLEALNKYNIILQFPAGTRIEDIDIASIKKISSLVGTTLTLDPHKPLPKKEENIGLFPKL